MSTASLYADWITLTRTARLYGPDEIADAVQRTNYILGEMIRANGAKQAVRGGTYIEERVRVSRQNNFKSYTPGEVRSATRSSTLQTVRFGWRFYENSITWTDADLDLSSESGDEFVVFKNFKKKMNDDLEIEHLEGMEDLCFAVPNSTTMDPISNTGGDAYSFPAFVSENSSTFLPPASAWTISTLAGLAPATVDKWRNQQETYVAGSLSDPETGVLAAFDKMCLKVKFITPPTVKAYMETDNLRAMKIVTNTDGRAIISRLYRNAQDQFRQGGQDAGYNDPTHNGVPIIHCAQLDTVNLNESPAGTYTGAPYGTGKPRYFWLNFKFLKLCFHRKHFMELGAPISGGAQQRDAFSQFKVSWTNIVTCNRNRLGIVYPSNP